MCKKCKIQLVLFIGLSFILCSNNPVAHEVRELTDFEKRLVEADNTFGFKLFKEINKQDVNKNLFISPLSVSMALGMTLNGANNETQEAMENTLEFHNMTTDDINQSYKSLIQLLRNLDSKVIFQIANSIWYRQGMVFEQAFIDRNKSYFDAVVRALDFNDPGSADIINAWVDDNTHGKITEIVDKPIDPLTVMFLINAIYFKGTWTYEFDKDLTQARVRANHTATRPVRDDGVDKLATATRIHRRIALSLFRRIDGRADLALIDPLAVQVFGPMQILITFLVTGIEKQKASVAR